MSGPLGTGSGNPGKDVLAGTGISVSGTTAFTVSNTGVTSLAGSGVSVSAATGAVTVTAPTVTGGTGISVSGSGTTSLTVSATGVQSLTAGTGISVSGTTTPTITNSGVTSIVAGTNVTVSGATGAVTVNAPGFATPGSSAIGDTAAAGTAATVSRSDHVHGREASGTPGASAVGDTVSAGTATTVALSDHRHSREAFGTPVAMAGATSDGSATTVARSDHQHGGTISFPLGTVSAPSIAPSGDSNTGLWSPAADTLAFSVAGGEAMRIVTKPSYKSVGINAPNPSWPLQIASPIDGNVCEFDGPGGGFFYANYANSTQYFLGFAGGSTPSTALAFGTQSAIPFYILSNNTGRVTITSGGNVGIGTWFNPSYQLELTANSAAKPTSSSWTISSDARIKTVIDDWRRGLAAIMQLQPKVYRLNGQYGSVDDGKNHISVIAQEAIEVMPEMIGSYQWQATREVQETMPDGQTTTRIEPDPTVEPVELYNLDTNALQWTLVNAIKELAGQVEALTARIAILEAQT